MFGVLDIGFGDEVGKRLGILAMAIHAASKLAG
jgi:hypothetical protein